MEKNNNNNFKEIVEIQVGANFCSSLPLNAMWSVQYGWVFVKVPSMSKIHVLLQVGGTYCVHVWTT
jgi:hypothetical protein